MTRGEMASPWVGAAILIALLGGWLTPPPARADTTTICLEPGAPLPDTGAAVLCNDAPPVTRPAVPTPASPEFTG